jgi:hypothetical protein
MDCTNLFVSAHETALTLCCLSELAEMGIYTLKFQVGDNGIKTQVLCTAASKDHA